LSKRQLADDDAYEPEESWLTRLKRRIGLDEEVEEADEPEELIGTRDLRGGKVVVRVHNSRPAEISVHLAPRTLDDGQSAADQLKQRRPVVLNLENTDHEIAMRLVDFVSGVTYALDGYYQRVGDKVFLFTPSNVNITIEDELDREQRTAFFDRDS